MLRLGRTTCNGCLHLISAVASQEGIKCTKPKELLRSYCLIYITVLVLIYDRIQAMTLGIRRMNELILSVVWIFSAASVNIHQDYQNTKTFYQKTWVLINWNLSKFWIWFKSNNLSKKKIDFKKKIKSESCKIFF